MPTTSSCSGRARARSSTSCRPAEIGCDVITVTHDLLRKLDGLGRDLSEFSLDTVRMFHRDAELSGYSL